MRKLLTTFILSLILCFPLTACGGPSDEKIVQAQEAYTRLVEVHNQAVEAHKHISDNSLDDELVALSEKVAKIEEFNLSEMKDEDIDALIESMDSILASYQEYLQVIEDIKGAEDAAVLVSIPLTLMNGTDQMIQKLFLYEQNDTSSRSDVLEGTAGFGPGQSLTGLVMFRDVSNTPWILEMENSNGTIYEIELPVKDYDESGITMTLTYDSESNELKATQS